jgi:hypothetical protein
VLLDVFNIGAPLSFITLKEADVHKLIALTVSIDAMLKPEKYKITFNLLKTKNFLAHKGFFFCCYLFLLFRRHIRVSVFFCLMV